MFRRILILKIFFLIAVGAEHSLASECISIFKEAVERADIQKIIFTPENYNAVDGIMIFDQKFKKVLTASVHLENGVKHNLYQISPYYEELVKATLITNELGEIQRVGLIMPFGKYELIFLKIQARDKMIFNLDALKNEPFGYKMIGEPVRFEIGDTQLGIR